MRDQVRSEGGEVGGNDRGLVLQRRPLSVLVIQV